MLDRKGEIRHDGGVVVDAPGLYRIGLNFLRRRKSSFIHGAEDDAVDLVEHLTAYLRSRQAVNANRAHPIADAPTRAPKRATGGPAALGSASALGCLKP